MMIYWICLHLTIHQWGSPNLKKGNNNLLWLEREQKKDVYSTSRLSGTRWKQMKSFTYSDSSCIQLHFNGTWLKSFDFQKMLQSIRNFHLIKSLLGIYSPRWSSQNVRHSKDNFTTKAFIINAWFHYKLIN